jgi:hypothetical protein
MDTSRLLHEDVLSGPGQIIVDNARGRILVADTRHHRIVITDLEGTVTHVIGTGNEGRADSVCEGSQFRHPQGIAADDNAKRLDADIAGCVSTSLGSPGRLDPQRKDILERCHRKVTVVTRELTGPTRDYFVRLERMAAIVLEAHGVRPAV